MLKQAPRGCSSPCCSLRVSLAISSPFRAAGALGVPTAPGASQLPLACPQYTMVTSPQGPEKSGRGATGALCVTAADSLLPLTPSLGQRVLPPDPPSSSCPSAGQGALSWATMYMSSCKGGALVPCALQGSVRGHVLGKRVVCSSRSIKSIQKHDAVTPGCIGKSCGISLSS